MKKVRWGVIGGSGIARRRTIPEGILPAANAALVAIMDRGAPARDGLQRQFGVPVVATVEQLLELPLDAVYIATPTFQHCAQALAAAAAGKHVLCEKPLGLDVGEAERIADACRAAGVKLGLGYMMRFHAAHLQIRQWLDSGRIGIPVTVRAQLACWHPPTAGHWRQVRALGGGGTLADLALHCFDLLEFLIGPVVEVSALTAALVQRYEDPNVEDSSVVALRFANGALGVVEAHFNLPDAGVENVLEITGTQGGIRAAHTIGQGSGGELRTSFGRKAGQAAVWKSWPLERGPNIYRAEIEAFSRCIQRGAEPPVSGETGVRGMRLLAACYESARSGKVIAVGEERVKPPIRKQPAPIRRST